LSARSAWDGRRSSLDTGDAARPCVQPSLKALRYAVLSWRDGS
jgi:hypothetical protein